MNRSRLVRVISLVVGLCMGVVLMPTSLQASPGKKAPKARTANSEAALTWKMLEHVFDTGTILVRDLLLTASKEPLQKVEVRARVQWNAGSLGRFAGAYLYYVKKLAEEFPGKAAVWKRWTRRVKQVVTASKLLRESALEGQKKSGLEAALQQLTQWQTQPLGAVPANLQGAQKKLLLDAISGLSTGIEFTGFHRLRQLAKQLKKKPADLASLRNLLASIKQYRQDFRTLKKRKPEAWMNLFVFHAELLFRAGVYLGRSALATGPKRAKMTGKYKHYLGMLESSLGKANASFGKFWRKAD